MNYEEWSPWVNITILCPWVNSTYFIIIIIIVVVVVVVVVNIIKIKRLNIVCLILDELWEWSPWVNIRILCPWVNSRYFIIIIIIIIIIISINIIK